MAWDTTENPKSQYFYNCTNNLHIDIMLNKTLFVMSFYKVNKGKFSTNLSFTSLAIRRDIFNLGLT